MHVVGFAFHKVLENVVNVVIVHYFVQIVVDVELRARIYDSFKFFQQLIERQVVGFRNGIKVHLSFDELLEELEAIVYSGTKLNINYYLNEIMDDDHVDDIFQYFMESETDNMHEALEELGSEYTEDEIRLVRIKFTSELAN